MVHNGAKELKPFTSDIFALEALVCLAQTFLQGITPQMEPGGKQESGPPTQSSTAALSSAQTKDKLSFFIFFNAASST